MKRRVTGVVDASDFDVINERFQYFRSTIARRHVEVSVSFFVSVARVDAELQQAADLVNLTGLGGRLFTVINKL